jgi:hypothetical protein
MDFVCIGELINIRSNNRTLQRTQSFLTSLVLVTAFASLCLNAVLIVFYVRMKRQSRDRKIEPPKLLGNKTQTDDDSLYLQNLPEHDSMADNAQDDRQFCDRYHEGTAYAVEVS